MTCVMELRLDRLRELLSVLEAKGITPRQISMQVAGTPDLVRHLLQGHQRDTRGDKMLRLAAAVGASVDYLYGRSDEIGDPPAVALLPSIERKRRSTAMHEPPARFEVLQSTAFLPVRHVVQAGAWLEVDQAAQHRVVSPPVAADPTFPRDAQWLEMVRGDSVDLFFPEGVFVHVVDAIAIGYAPRHDDFVVVERRREQGGLVERSLKQVEKRGRRIELWPRSRNPKWSAPLNLIDVADETTEVEIAALVLGGYLPTRK